MPKSDRVRLRHMLDAAGEALSLAEGHTRTDLDRDRQLILSLLYCVVIVGEAATQISRETREAHPEIPWPGITAMRNRLLHVYFDIDLDLVWDTVSDDLPALVAELEKLVPPEEITS